MTLTEFAKTMEADVKRFNEYWQAEHNEDPNMYPWDLPEPEWYEQFMAFLS